MSRKNAFRFSLPEKLGLGASAIAGCGAAWGVTQPEDVLISATLLATAVALAGAGVTLSLRRRLEARRLPRLLPQRPTSAATPRSGWRDAAPA